MRMTFKGLRVLVIGLGRFGGGVGVTRWLAERGAVVTVTDQADRDSLRESLDAVSDLDVALHLGGHDACDLDAADLVIVNPAVIKHRSEFFGQVLRRGLSWTTEMNLFCERCPATVVGVTGSYGKSTTCAMLADVLRAAVSAKAYRYTAVHLGGNIGRSLLTELSVIRADDIVVLEMSNAQLEDLPRINWAPQVAVITNLSPHHLDRYTNPEEYFTAKLNIVRDPARGSPVIVGSLDPIAETLLAEALGESQTRMIRVPPPEEPFKLRVPGGHNQWNAACTATVAQQLGIDSKFVRLTLQRFAGLPHRLEFIRTIGNVDYYDDSKSTAPSATIMAVESFDRPIVAIVGGQRKETPLTAWAAAMTRTCRSVICLGESGPAFFEALRSSSGIGNARTAGDPFLHSAADLEAALRRAQSLARPGDVVLFSPGAPSFDRYANFTERGRHFAKLVHELSD